MIDVISLTQKLIQFPSVTPANAAIFDFLAPMLEGIGFKTCRQTFHKAGTDSVENLYAYLGTSGPHLGFIGHLDVVPPGNEQQWTYPPFDGVIKENYIYGRGAADMKGSIAAFIGAAAALAPLPHGQISLLLTGDEEGPSVNGIAPLLNWIHENHKIAEAYLLGEPTSDKIVGDTVKPGGRGSLNAIITSRGKQGHVGYPHLADNPIPRLIAFLQAAHTYTLDQGNERFDPSCLVITSIDVGNSTTNIIPSTATARLNIRFNTEHTGTSLQAWLYQLSQQYEVEILAEVSGEPFYSQPTRLHSIATEVIQDIMGVSPNFSTGGGTSDARFAQAYAPVLELGLCNATIHQVDEHVLIKDLQKLQDIYQDIVKRFLKQL